MKAEEIIEGNQLIANFMGYVLKPAEKGVYAKAQYWQTRTKRTAGPDDFIGYLDTLYFHEQWSWLMPVVEKIFQTPFEDGTYPSFRTFGMIDYDTGGYMVRIDRHRVFSSEKLIESTWLAVIDFIETLSQAKN